MTTTPTVLAISGGVGGAKLALGLERCLPRGELAVLVNTGDDFRHLGLWISPDLDTVMYTLGGVVNPGFGWGRSGDTFAFLEELRNRGGPGWFALGDRDLVVHVERTQRLLAGERLTDITADLALRFGVGARLLPMSDAPVSTRLETAAGTLEFQHYFVRLRCEPVVTAIHFEGAALAEPSAEALELLASPHLRAVVLCPSNPYLSIDPVLAIPGLRAALRRCPAPVVAISPVIGGRAVKGPTAKLMTELGVEVSPGSIARHYAGLIDGLVIDQEDAAAACALDLPVLATQTLMRSLEDRERLAAATLEFAGGVRQRHRGAPE